jgi:hypothetical protein
LIYERADEPMLFIDADTDETGRYSSSSTNKGTSNKNELFVKDLGDPMRRSSTRRSARCIPATPRSTIRSASSTGRCTC